MERRFQYALLAVVALGSTVSTSLAAQAGDSAAARRRTCDSICITPTRTVSFETTQGTWMNVDVSPDGRTILFDLLGDIYTVPVTGGKATRLTSGLAYDIHPVYSPDGAKILYVTDRSGSDNLWIMDADGKNAKPLTRDREGGFGTPEWSPDGEWILAKRRNEVRLFHRDGGQGTELAKGFTGGGPTWSPDGRYVYIARGGGGPAAKQIARLDRMTGDVATITASPIGAFRPRISPDGKWAVYGSRVDAKTGLRIRNLQNDVDEWLLFPIDRDDTEGFGAGDHLPRFDFMPDGQSIIVATGGTFHRVDLRTKRDDKIAFSATVEQGLGPFVYNQYRLNNDPVAVRSIRYAATNRDKSQMTFGALNKVYVMDQPGGSPKELVSQSFGQFQPVYSPDGASIAYVTWDDVDGGHVWRAPARGGTPQRLTTEAGYYMHPIWSPDGSKIALIREDPADDRNVWSRNTGIVQWLSSNGGPVTSVVSAPSDNRLTFSPDGTRIMYVTAGRELTSVRLDGTDKHVMAKFTTTNGATVDEVVPSPDGKWVAFSNREDLYLAALPTVSEPPTITETSGPGPVKRITREGGMDVRWENGGRTLTWVFANKLYRIDRERAMATAAGADSTLTRPEVTTINLSLPRAYPTGSVALRGARIITMHGAEVIPKGDVVVTDNRITAIGASGKVAIPKGAKVYDVSGKTIMPGFIDMHAHLRAPRDVFVQEAWPYLANLAFGITSARDVSSSNDELRYGELVEAGRMLGPRIFSVGRAMTTSNARVDNLEDARAIVRHYKQMGAVVLKQYQQPQRRQREWILQAAREEGINITNEGGGDVRQDLTMVLDGYTGWEHALPWGNLHDDIVQLVAKSGTWYTPTLVVAYGGPTAEWYFYQSTNVHDDAKLRFFTPHEVIDRRTRRGQMNALDEYHFLNVARDASAILKAGGHVTMGAHGEEQGICAHWEIWALQMGGMSNHDALRTATSLGAEGLGLQQDLGSLEAGKLADLVVLDKNPLDNIRNTNSVRWVMKNGELFDASDLTMMWPREKKLRPFKFRDYSAPATPEMQERGGRGKN